MNVAKQLISHRLAKSISAQGLALSTGNSQAVRKPTGTGRGTGMGIGIGKGTGTGIRMSLST